MTIDSRITRAPRAGGSLILACFSYRHDAHLVPALLANLSPMTHGWVAWDDRAAPPGLSDEGGRRAALLARARDMGAGWILAADPDERFADALAGRMADLTTAPAVWTFACREMFTPVLWRADGIWGRKAMARLFPVMPGMRAETLALHGEWFAYEASPPRADSGLAFCHLRMATPERRAHRRALYAAADPERRMQPIGYDYLDDMRGAVLRPLAAQDLFTPPHQEDGGIWAPPLDAVGNPVPDPAPATLRFILRSQATGGLAAAAHRAADLAEAAPEDQELALLAAHAALLAGLWGMAQARLDGLLALWPDCALGHLLQSRLLRRQGMPALAAADRALALAPTSHVAADTRSRALPLAGRPAALWRRWCDGPARLTEGAQVARADMAVVVIGLGAPAELAGAVDSVLTQDERPEIVVVNSGGGDTRAVLGDRAVHVRLIEVEARLMVGAARNIGIDATDAPFVAFLAGDCLALPGWVSGRMARHRDGAAAVSNPVVPDRPDNLFSQAASTILQWRRWPRPTVEPRSRYGLSYARHLFEDGGYFPPGLRVAEDTALNERLWDRVRVDWAPDVLTAHRYPVTLRGFLADQARRGPRRLAHPPYDVLRGAADASQHLNALTRKRAQALAAPLAELAVTRRMGPLRRAALAGLVRLGLWADQRATRRALDATPKVPAQDGREMARLGAALLREGDLDAGLAALAQARSLMPGNVQATEPAVAALIAAGRGSEALALAESACLVAPFRPHLWIVARHAAMAGRDLALARMLLQAGLLADPSFGSIHGYLRQIAALQGDTPGAARRAAMAAALGPPG